MQSKAKAKQSKAEQSKAKQKQIRAKQSKPHDRVQNLFGELLLTKALAVVLFYAVLKTMIRCSWMCPK